MTPEIPIKLCEIHGSRSFSTRARPSEGPEPVDILFEVRTPSPRSPDGASSSSLAGRGVAGWLAGAAGRLAARRRLFDSEEKEGGSGEEGHVNRQSGSSLEINDGRWTTVKEEYKTRGTSTGSSGETQCEKRGEREEKRARDEPVLAKGVPALARERIESRD
ncbi:hypothetical protein Mp_1g09760 [Marchantia polymorpha subsp. ruderalis]|uniref:Uncharacterized protein n=2 Tax=Marchantia polymorpha TaxID=3197 RepID=A0AAF6AND7_MARPO|nr:hypothetical protein MARPO_0096s0025 [Marchantia polymorpha]BBM97957.1 hypothetical protein Mp_1g09760 [Marchantia polymorpha subsp. ruderalis]|eukprot:PTQ32673.1 hypothetical protein MARPO_0096s0025 [Marchantia polymorpha]